MNMARKSRVRRSGLYYARPRDFIPRRPRRLRPFNIVKPLRTRSRRVYFDFDAGPERVSVPKQVFKADAFGSFVRKSHPNYKLLSVCSRRRSRREVLHAFHKSGKVGQRRPKWTADSFIKCKG